MAGGSRPDWHPILQAQEYEPGRWVIFDIHEHPYGLIDFIRRGRELGYRATRWKQETEHRELIGYYRNLRAAAMAIHRLKMNEGVVHGHPSDALTGARRSPGKANTPARTERD